MSDKFNLNTELGPQFELKLESNEEFTLTVGTKSSSLFAGGGETGPQGPIGPQGEQGLTGPQGIPGEDSVVPGPIGSQGPKGDTGNTGADSTVPGPVGPTGPQGIKGDTGDAGADGINGSDGADSTVAGPTGPEGPSGPQGPIGPIGVTGSSAYQSAVNTGFVGTESEWIASVQGVEGPIGPEGPSGADSTVAGPQGPIGPAGSDGATGTTGSQGPAGSKGDSAYDIAVTNGFVGTEAQWLTSLEGAEGPQGPAGADGTGGGSSIVQTEITGNHTVVDADLVGNVIRRMKNVTQNTQTITVNTGLTEVQPATFIATDTGGVTFIAGAGITILAADNNMALRVPYSSATLIPDVTTSGTYYLVGDLIQFTDMILPVSIPMPIVWFSPRNVELNVNNGVTKYLNRGTGGSAYDAVARTATLHNILEKSKGWNDKDVISIPNSGNGGYAMNAVLSDTRSFFTMTTYQTIGQASFTNFDGIISGPITDVGDEFELVGSSGSANLLINANQTIYKNDVAGSQVGFLPCDKDTVGSTLSVDGFSTQSLWYDNNNLGRNWYGINGDMMIWDVELTTTQLTTIHTFFAEYYGTGDGS